MHQIICPTLFEMARRVPANAVQVAAKLEKGVWVVTYIIPSK